MRLSVSLAVISFLIPQVASAQLVRHNSIPETYWGTWAPADANCQDANKPSIALTHFHARHSRQENTHGDYSSLRHDGLRLTRQYNSDPVKAAFQLHVPGQ
jgi:hypothetical protein